MAVAEQGWTGQRLSGAQTGAILFVGVAGILFAGVGPLLLGDLQAIGRISAAQLGLAGMAELLMMGIAAGATGPLYGLRNLRLLAIVSGLAMAMCNCLSIYAQGWEVVLVRGLNGIPSGALIWLMTAMIVRSATPERWAAIYLTVQTLAQAAIVAALNSVVGGSAITTGFAVLAAIGLGTAAVGPLVPNWLATLPVDPEQPNGKPSPRGLIALAGTFAFNAAILAVWMYMEPLSRQAGHAAGTAGTALTLSLAAQVLGGLTATVAGSRVRTGPTLLIALVTLAAGMIALVALPGATVFLAVSAGIGFFWMFGSPFFTPLVIEADPTRRAAMFGSGAALLGCAAGPLIASLLVSDSDVRASLILGILLIGAAMTVVVGLSLVRSRRGSVAA